MVTCHHGNTMVERRKALALISALTTALDQPLSKSRAPRSMLHPWPQPAAGTPGGTMSATATDSQLFDLDAASELAHRSSDGVDVTLWWLPASGSLLVAVRNDRTGDAFTLDAPADRAHDVFAHPYAYAAAQGVAYHVHTPYEDADDDE